ncbi:bacteriocin-like protein [Chryseobacterium gambrini]|uniref:bacteriocin-like protein n=1 Tax=Chryseobacterium gambrini TaxID=373672 RepID=UPI003F53EF93
MKNLKKLSREELRNVNGGKMVPGNCGNMCSLGDSTCGGYGLDCGLYWVYNSSGVATSGCLRCI